MAKLVVVKTCNKLIGISSKDVKEIVELVKIHPAPFVIPSIRGTAFWRGAVLTIVSLKSILNDNVDEDSRIYIRLLPYTNLLVEAGKIEDIIEYNELKLDEKGTKSVFKGIYFYNERAVSVLDIEKFSLAIEEEVIGTLRYGVNWR